MKATKKPLTSATKTARLDRDGFPVSLNRYLEPTNLVGPLNESPTALIDALTLEIGRADSLTGLLAKRLSDLDEEPDAPAELYALSLIAEHIVNKLQLIHDKALELHKDRAKTGKPRKTGGAR